MKTIAILVDNRERLEFFMRRVAERPDCQFVLLHSSLFSFSFARKKPFLTNFEKNVQNILLRSKGNSKIINCIEYYKGNFIKFPKIDMARLPNIQLDELWLFNGYQSAALQLKSSLQYNEIRYFEIGNFPNKYQVNKYGINANARYKLGVSDSGWTNNTLTELTEYIPPHTKKNLRSSVFEYFINFLGGRMFKTVAPVSGLALTILHAISFKLAKMELKKYQQVELPEKYHLFVGQVNADTQIIFQSDENNLSAIKKWFRQKSKSELPLVYRFHPAERDVFVIRQVVKYCAANGILVSNTGSIIHALRNSCTVSMINSTSGIYALLLHKEVTCFGHSIFGEWGPEQAQAYVSVCLKNDIS